MRVLSFSTALHVTSAVYSECCLIVVVVTIRQQYNVIANMSALNHVQCSRLYIPLVTLYSNVSHCSVNCETLYYRYFTDKYLFNCLKLFDLCFVTSNGAWSVSRRPLVSI